MQSLYHHLIMDHYHFPRHKGLVQGDSCFVSKQANPSCGDTVTVSLCLASGMVDKGAWQAQGCILSLAAADILLEAIRGKTLDEVRALSGVDMQKIVGIQAGPTRIKCLLLPLEAVKESIRDL